AKLIALTLLG
nr:paraoxonase=arylesterase {EC 3.1.1.2} [human, serum, Peptide Partial, 10 aa] [Homo sapiens]